MSANKIIINGVTVLDLTKDTATPETVVYGKIFHTASGEQKVGVLKHGEYGLELLILDDSNGNVMLRTFEEDYVIVEDDGNGNVTIKLADPYKPLILDDGNGNVIISVEDAERETYAVTYNLTDVLKSSTVTSVKEGMAYSVVLVSNSNAFQHINVTMGVVDITDSCVTVDENAGTAFISIDNVTGDLAITAFGGVR